MSKDRKEPPKSSASILITCLSPCLRRLDAFDHHCSFFQKLFHHSFEQVLQNPQHNMSTQLTQPSMASTMVRAFAIPELLIIVLQLLPMKGLLHAQRVCLVFREPITNTAALQQALFFEARVPMCGSKLRSSLGLGTEINPLLQKMFSCWFTDWRYHDTPTIPRSHVQQDTASERLAQEALTRKEAIRRNMLLCQPLIEVLQVFDALDRLMEPRGIQYNHHGDDALTESRGPTCLDCSKGGNHQRGLRKGFLHDIVWSLYVTEQGDWRHYIVIGLDCHHYQDLKRDIQPDQRSASRKEGNRLPRILKDDGGNPRLARHIDLVVEEPWPRSDADKSWALSCRSRALE